MVHEKINPSEVDAKITTHKGDASAHHPVHVKTLEDHPLSIIPAIPPDQLSAIDSPADGEAPTYNAAEGKFEWKVAAGVTKLSELIIDVNKDWAGKVIKNVGAPVDPTDVLRLTDLTAHIGVADAHHAVHLKTLADHPLSIIPDITPGKLDAIDSPGDGEVPTYNLAQGKFEWKAMVGISSLSELVIDVSKDWGGYVIKNLGAPVDAGDVYSKGNAIALADIYPNVLGLDSLGKLVLTQVGTKVADLATLWTKATKIAYADLNIANSVLVSDIKSTEFNVANKLLKLDAEAHVPLAQIPSPLSFKDLELQEAPTQDHRGKGLYIIDTVGEAVGVGDVLYMKSDGKWWKADADAATTMPGAALAMEAKSADQDCKMLLFGFFRDDSWSWTVGGSAGLLYVSTTPGPPTQTAPSGTGDQVQVLGIAIAATIILFNPSYELVEVS